MIKEIPILFSGVMILAKLDKRKTMTRRLTGLDVINADPSKWNFIEVDSPFKDPCIYWFEGQGERVAVKCPFGKTGDLLWVRENFRVGKWFHEDGDLTFRYEADGIESPRIVVDTDETDSRKFFKYWEQSCDDLFKAGIEPNDEGLFKNYDYKALRLRPNIFLPKPAARIWLQVESVRVERLQDISEEDAKAEGVKGMLCQYTDGSGQGYTSYVESFKKLWREINGADSWRANPWVWVVSFKVLSSTGKPDLNTINK